MDFFRILFIVLPIPLIFTLVLALLFFKRNRFIFFALLIAFWARIFFSIGYNFYLSEKSLHDYPEHVLMVGGDGEFQSGHAWLISVINLDKDVKKNDLMWKKGFFSDIWTYEVLFLQDRYIPVHYYQVGFYTYFMAVLYSYFGYSPLIVNFINCMLGVLAAFLIYQLCLIFNKRVANLSLFLMLWWPSLFFWSALTKLKITGMIFLSALFLLLTSKFILQKKIIYLPLIIATTVLVDLFRVKFSFIFAGIFIFSLFLTFKTGITKNIISMIGCIFLALNFNKLVLMIKKILDSGITIHHGVVNTGGVIYKLLEDRHYLKVPGFYPLSGIDYLKYYLKGLLYFIFEPFLTNISSKNILIFLPQQILWYLLLILSIFGALYCIRYFRKESIVLFVYLFVITSMLGISGGNIGTDVRHRDLISPVVFIFSSLGLMHLLGYKLREK